MSNTNNFYTPNKIASPVAGCMRWGKWGACFTTADYRQMIDACLAAGISSFDHADIYGHYTTEQEFGAALAEAPQLRPQLQLITKCGIKLVSPNRPGHLIKSYDCSSKHIIQSVEQSLQNFRTDYLDLLLIHRPSPLLNPEELAATVSQLVAQGKILSFGLSNFLPHQVDMVQRFIPVAYNQIEVSALHLSPFTNGMLDHCVQHNITPMAWSPLGGGLLHQEDNLRNARVAAVCQILAEQYQTGTNQILIAWLLQHPSGILPVLGTTRIERLQQALAAQLIQLTTEQWFMIWRASTGEEVA